MPVVPVLPGRLGGCVHVQVRACTSDACMRLKCGRF